MAAPVLYNASHADPGYTSDWPPLGSGPPAGTGPGSERAQVGLPEGSDGAFGETAMTLPDRLAMLMPGALLGSVHFCDLPSPKTAADQDRVLSFAATIRSALDASGHRLAILSRSGIQLAQFGIRYSHSGIALRDGTEVPWSIRQLYFACDEGRPRLFDEGVAAYLFNSADKDSAFVSVVLLPKDEEQAIHDAALDRTRALRLLASRYSANAFPFSTRYQNCNQWVIEMVAAGYGGMQDDPLLRTHAQRWLYDNGYRPDYIEVESHLTMLGGGFVPLLHFDDHPPHERYDRRYRLSMPASIETFLRQHSSGARRIAFCHNGREVVVREGWEDFGERCEAGEGDRVVPL